MQPDGVPACYTVKTDGGGERGAGASGFAVVVNRMFLSFPRRAQQQSLCMKSRDFRHNL